MITVDSKNSPSTPIDQRVETVVFCDLDGTLVLENSFHTFIGICVREARGMQRLSLLLALSLRGLGRLSGGHSGLKRRVLRWFAGVDATTQKAVVSETCKTLKRTIAAPVQRYLAKRKAEGARLVLATAAPDAYAADFAASQGFEACIATPTAVTPDWRECLGAEKQAACEAWVSAAGLAQTSLHRVVLSDHADDLPLMQGATALVLCCSAERAAQIQTSIAPTQTATTRCIIDPEAAQPGGGFWLWFDGSPLGPLDEWEVRTILSKHRYAALYVGGGQWCRQRPGDDRRRAVLRTDCPLPPSALFRLRLELHRRIERDALGIFH